MSDYLFDPSLFDPDPFELSDEGGAPAVTGTVATVQAAQETLGAGVLAFIGVDASEKAPQEALGAGVLAFAGSVTMTQAPQTLATDGVETFVGAATLAQAAQIGAGTGAVGVSIAPVITARAEAVAVGTLSAYVSLYDTEAPWVISGSVAMKQARQTVRATGHLRIAGAVRAVQCEQSACVVAKLGFVGRVVTSGAGQMIAVKAVYSTDNRDRRDLADLLALLDAA